MFLINQYLVKSEREVKGGNKSLRVRFMALKAYIAFLHQRKTYGGMTRAQMTFLLEYLGIWSLDFTDMVAQKKHTYEE